MNSSISESILSSAESQNQRLKTVQNRSLNRRVQTLATRRGSGSYRYVPLTLARNRHSDAALPHFRVKTLAQPITQFHLFSIVNLAFAARDFASSAVMVQPGGRLWPVGGLPMRI